jgi:hypothetical protein
MIIGVGGALPITAGLQARDAAQGGDAVATSATV